MTEEKIPCKNCITIVMCKERLCNLHESSDVPDSLISSLTPTLTMYKCIEDLKNHCGLIQQFINNRSAKYNISKDHYIPIFVYRYIIACGDRNERRKSTL